MRLAQSDYIKLFVVDFDPKSLLNTLSIKQKLVQLRSIFAPSENEKLNYSITDFVNNNLSDHFDKSDEINWSAYISYVDIFENHKKIKVLYDNKDAHIIKGSPLVLSHIESLKRSDNFIYVDYDTYISLLEIQKIDQEDIVEFNQYINVKLTSNSFMTRQSFVSWFETELDSYLNKQGYSFIERKGVYIITLSDGRKKTIEAKTLSHTMKRNMTKHKKWW